MAEASGSVSGEEDALWSEAKALEELMQMRRAAWRAEPDNQVLQTLYADSRDMQVERDKECAGSLAALPGEPVQRLLQRLHWMACTLMQGALHVWASVQHKKGLQDDIVCTCSPVQHLLYVLHSSTADKAAT